MNFFIKALVTFFIFIFVSFGYATGYEENECEPCEAGDVTCGGDAEGDSMSIILEE